MTSFLYNGDGHRSQRRVTLLFFCMHLLQHTCTNQYTWRAQRVFNHWQINWFCLLTIPKGTAGSRDRVVHIVNAKHSRWHLSTMARMRHMINLEAGATEGCHSWVAQSFKNLSLWAWIIIITASTAFLERSYVDSDGYKRTADHVHMIIYVNNVTRNVTFIPPRLSQQPGIISLLDSAFYYWLTPRSRVLLEKLTGFQAGKKFPAFYRTLRFITAFTSSRHLSLFWARSIQSVSPSHFLQIHFNIHLRSTPGSSTWSLSLWFPHQNPVSTPPLPYTCYIPHPSHSFWVFMWSSRYFCTVLMKCMLAWQILMTGSQYRISQISVQWEPRLYMRIYRRRDKHDEANKRFQLQGASSP